MSFFYAAIFPVPQVFDNTTTCFFPSNELDWILIYYKIEYALVRVFIPFLLMTISSIMVTYKMCEMKTRLTRNTDLERERQMFISLISHDIFFIVFRIPMVIYSIINNNSVLFFDSFGYCICLAIGLLSNVFMFIVFIFFNKVYKQIFIQIMVCRPKTQKPQGNVNNMIRNQVAGRNVAVNNVKKKVIKEWRNIDVKNTKLTKNVNRKDIKMKTQLNLDDIIAKNSVDLKDVKIIDSNDFF